MEYTAEDMNDLLPRKGDLIVETVPFKDYDSVRPSVRELLLASEMAGVRPLERVLEVKGQRTTSLMVSAEKYRIRGETDPMEKEDLLTWLMTNYSNPPE